MKKTISFIISLFLLFLGITYVQKSKELGNLLPDGDGVGITILGAEILIKNEDIQSKTASLLTTGYVFIGISLICFTFLLSVSLFKPVRKSI